ncbi:MAG: winged helix-turn-helix transcriptional regulator [Deltaproteobacteria bacterium]|nr:winged helix-turn-helix transcriptional regulator [Deltaproteobacteria bacterium]
MRAYEDIMKAASDPTRVRILKILEGGEMCVCQIIAVIALGQSTISKHLFLLRAAGLIKDRRDKKWIHYSLDGKSVNLYAGPVLRNLRKWLNDDPLVLKDRERAAMAREIGPIAICEHGMKLPGRRSPLTRFHNRPLKRTYGTARPIA